MNVNDEIRRLGRKRYPQLVAEALKIDIDPQRIRVAATADELRRLILLKRLEGVGVRLG
jgi:hypothetical protein